MKPVGVRLHRADGTVLNCELIDEGTDEQGMHSWRIANVVYRPGDQLTVAKMPPYTSIWFAAPQGLTGADIEWSEESGERARAHVDVDYEKMWRRPDG